jgi:hypothetical protein
MAQLKPHKRKTEKVADIVRDAGGRIVGRTRLQKIGYLLELSGLGAGFSFEYRHYGPYSEELAVAARNSKLLGLLDEEERPTDWGGFYSVFTVNEAPAVRGVRPELIGIAADADPIELELAATAAFLSLEGADDPWGETAKRKPEKAKRLYRRLQKIKTPTRLPRIV